LQNGLSGRLLTHFPKLNTVHNTLPP